MTQRPRVTPSQTIGPFFEFALLATAHSELVPVDTQEAIRIQGVVSDGRGEPVSDAMIEIWQAAPDGQYVHRNGPSQDSIPGAHFTGFGRAGTDESGIFRFVTVKPGTVPWLDGRPQAPHIDVSVFARGLLNRLVTRLYFPDEVKANATDPLLSSIQDVAIRQTLIAQTVGAHLQFDIRLQGEGETCFFEL
ncbi:MAG: protocatechuate 3,4-dioxygenase subunit alpha [Chloroflexota bacterium]